MTDYTETEMECVRRGAEFLDQHWPGWELEIDVSRLDLGSSCDCVLGQLGVDYGKSTIQFTGHPLSVAAHDKAESNETNGFDWITSHIFPGLGMTDEDVEYYGFDDGYDGDEGYTSYKGLTAAWQQTVLDRRLAASIA